MKNQFISKEEIISYIYEIIDQHNESNKEDLLIKKDLDTELIGNKGNLDSLGLINFLIEVEVIMKKKVDKKIFVIDENLFLDENGPYKNINTLCEFILNQVG